MCSDGMTSFGYRSHLDARSTENIAGIGVNIANVNSSVLSDVQVPLIVFGVFGKRISVVQKKRH